MTQFNRICVVGLGYVGLPTAVVLASRGVSVLGYDISRRSVDAVNSGKPHIVEAGLDEMLQAAHASGKLTASISPEPCDAFLIAVPTPVTTEHAPEMGAVFSATRAIAKVIQKGNLVILESTSPPGSTLKMCEMLAEARPELKFPHEHPEEADVQVAFCPERILPGETLHELIDNDRVIGGIDNQSAQRAADLYRIFCKGALSLSTATTAEMVKCTENSFRDVNIAFANELSLICDQLGVNVSDVIALANRHPRVNILQPGAGVGGHCIPVDPWFIVDAAPDLSRLIRTAREVNEHKTEHVAHQVLDAAGHGATVAILGLAYKPDVDDMRESPAIEICRNVANRGDLEVLAVEPHLDELPDNLRDLGAIVRLAELKEALSSADVIVGLVAHSAFKGIGPDDLKGKTLIDPARILPTA